MATALQAILKKTGRYAAYAAIAALLLAIASHLVNLEGVAEFFGDAAFFLLVLAVVTRRD